MTGRRSGVNLNGSMAGRNYVLLCRHGETQPSSPRAAAHLSRRGRRATTEVARTLAETLALDDEIDVTAVWCGTHSAVEETLKILRLEIETETGRPLPEAELKPLLDPEQFKAHAWRSKDGAAPERELAAAIRALFDAGGGAVLVVGHQPMLSWIGQDLLSGGPLSWLRRRRLPLTREVACISLGPGRRPRASLAWSVEVSDSATAEALRKKIEAKIEIAKWLAGVLIFALGAVLGLALDPGKLRSVYAARRGASVLLPLAGGSLFLAIGLYLATVWAYDRLLMPTRFWAESPPTARTRPHWLVRRPPSSANYILYQNMIRIWQRMFLPGTVLVLAGIGLLGYVALGLRLWQGLVGAGAALAIVGWYFVSRPRLGTED